MQYKIKTIYQLGIALKSLRKSSGFTQKEITNKVGLLQKTISSLESGASQSTIESLMKLLAALECDIILVPKNTNSTDEKTSW